MDMEKKTCTAAKVLGIVGIVLGLFIPLLGICCGIVGIIVCKETAAKNEELDIKSGMILSVAAIVISVISWVAGAMMLSAMYGA